MPHILVVEDEPSIAQSLEHVLQADGFSTKSLTTGMEATAYLAEHTVDLVILDIGLPDTSGFEVCKQVRRHSEVPIIFLTARSEEIDRVVGLEIGADDYVTKPFSPREVVARVRAILKRSIPRLESQNSEFQQSASAAPENRQPVILENHSKQRKFFYFGQPLNLTKAEYLLLQAMHNAVEQVFTREQLLAVLGVSAAANYDRSIDTHIKSLRAKLRAVNPECAPIKTERGFGYRLSWPQQ